MKFIIINGEVMNKEEANISSFYFNDLLIINEKVWFGFGGIPLLKEKMEQITQQLKDFGANVPALFLNQREFFRRIKRMLNKNRFYRTGLINFQILISKTETNFVLVATPFEQTEFIYHDNGILINFSDIHKYSKSPIQTKNSQANILELLATAKYRDLSVQKSFFLNETGMICDAGSANIFFVKNNVILTPSLETGCISDNIRVLVLEASKNIGLQINESTDIAPESVKKMNEIFIAAESTGIQRVLGIETKRFVHSVSLMIHKELNEILKKKALN